MILAAKEYGRDESMRAVASRTRLFVFGPRTRLAAALLRSPWARAQAPVLIARDSRERAWAESTYPSATSLVAGDPELPGERRHAVTAIAGCALGLVHPEAPALAADMGAVARDVAMVEAILAAHPDTSAHVVFVSSILALSTSRGRGYYGGWKSVTEGALTAVVQRHPHAALSVLYPGRLVERRTIRNPTSLLAASYSYLAAQLVRTLRAGVPTRRVVGSDARLWLIARGVAAGRAALRGALRP